MTTTGKSPIAAVLWLLVAAGSVSVPLFVAPTDIDAFRLPKELLFEAIAALCAAVLGILWLYSPSQIAALARARAAALSVAGAAVAWTVITTLTSTNRQLSLLSLLWVISAAVMFAATVAIANRGRGIWIVSVLFCAASFNAILAILQRAKLYNPFVFDPSVAVRLETTAMVGNPNDVATYLLFPTLAAAVLALVSRERWRVAGFTIVTLLLTAGIAATATLTAIFAYACAGTVLIALRTRRIVAPFLAVAACAIVLFLAYAPLRQRAVDLARHARSGRYVQILSLRVPAFAAALEMFKDHPLVGVGPGCFGWWYLPYKLELNQRYPSFYASVQNFGEVHNDHLQTLSVSGFPGYLIYAGAVVLLGSLSVRRRLEDQPEDEQPESVREAFSRLGSLPFAVAFAVVTLGQFPLELAPALNVILHLAAVCVAWSDA